MRKNRVNRARLSMLVLIVVGCTASSARWVAAALPAYLETRIYARTGVTAFQMPAGSSLGSSTVSLNDRRTISADVNFVGSTGNPGVFYGNWISGAASGGIVYFANDTIVGDPQLDAAGRVIFAVGFDNDPFVYDPLPGMTTPLNYPLGVTGSSGLAPADGERLGGRVEFGFSGEAYGTFPKQAAGFPSLTIYAADSGLDVSSDLLFLFTPALSRSGGVGDAARVAAKVSMTAGFDFEEIRIFDADGSSTTVAVETETDPLSPFSEFVTNSVSISHGGRMVAFQATSASGVSGIYRYDDVTQTTDLIAAVGTGPVGTIDIFAPDVNDAGLVTFRGDDASGLSSVFVGDGSQVVRLAGEGDLLMTDLGLRQLGRRDGDFSQSGAPRINNRGDVAFALQYFDPSNGASVADGTLIMMQPVLTGDFDADGAYACRDVDALTSAIVMGSHDGAFDLTGDGEIDRADLTAWLAEAGAAQLPGGGAYLPADANLDSVVDIADFNIWNAHRFSTLTGWCGGDFNADGVVDVSDFHVWNGSKFQAAAIAVPEPTAIQLILGGLFVLASAHVISRDSQDEAG